MVIVTKQMAEIRPYERNPRANDGAVEAVAASIAQCGYISPIILDEGGVILAGHTRYKALLHLGYTDAQCIVCPGLTAEQKRKFRLLDNKTGELAEWDQELLAIELEGLDFGDLDLDWISLSDDEEQGPLDLEDPTEPDPPSGDLLCCPKCGFSFEVK